MQAQEAEHVALQSCGTSGGSVSSSQNTAPGQVSSAVQGTEQVAQQSCSTPGGTVSSSQKESGAMQVTSVPRDSLSKQEATGSPSQVYTCLGCFPTVYSMYALPS